MQQIVAIVLILLGIAGVAAGLLADSLGISSAPNAIGWKQIALAAVGGTVAIAGAVWLVRLRGRTE